MSEKTIRWGIIGLGRIATKFATDLATVENTTLVAVASRSLENANAFARKFKVEKAYGSYEELATDSSVDAVYIATPHSFHKKHTLLCLHAKKAVLCEKPFAMNLEEVEEMITVAKANNVLLMEALWTYFLPHYRYVLEIISAKTYGKITALKADFGFYNEYDTARRLFKKEVGGGSLLDIGIYPIFTALSTLGTPNEIAAEATFFENGADSSCKMVFGYNEAIATLNSSLLEETKTEAIFMFEKATVKINGQFHAPTSVSILKNGVEEIVDFNYKTIGYNYEIEHFNTLLRTNKTESSIMTFDFSRKLITTLDSVRKVIKLDY